MEQAAGFTVILAHEGPESCLRFHFGKQAILIEIASENEVVPEKSCSFSETTL